MPQITPPQLLRLLVFSLFSLVLIFANGRTGAMVTRQEPSEDAWVTENYKRVMESRLPAQEPYWGGVANDVVWMAVVRIQPPFERGELRFRLKLKANGTVEASVMTPEPDSVFKQLRKLRKQFPNDTVEDLSAKVNITTKEFTDKSMPELRELARALERMKVSPIPPSVIMMDSTGYGFWIWSVGGQIEANLQGSGPKALRQTDALVRWAEDFRRSIDSFMQRQEKPPKR